MLRELWAFLKQLVVEFIRDDVVSVASGLAFWTVMSLAPLAFLLVAVGGWLGPHTQGEVIGQVGTLVGVQAQHVIELVIQDAEDPGAARFAGWLGFPALFFSSTAVFVQLQGALNRTWGVQPNPKIAGWFFLRARLISMAMLVAFGLLVVSSLVVSTAVSVTVRTMGGGAFLRPAELGGSLVVLICGFAVVFKALPDVEIWWRDVAVGATITGVLFTLGKHLIGLFLASTKVGSIYGAAGSVIVLLLWVYYSVLVFLVGAEITQLVARRYGHGVRPNRWAIRIPGRGGVREGRGGDKQSPKEP